VAMVQAQGTECAAVVGGKVIVMGGRDNNFKPLNSCESYDPVQEKWRSVPSMITERYGACAAVVDGKVIVMGGRDDTPKRLNSCEMYDLESPPVTSSDTLDCVGRRTGHQLQYPFCKQDVVDLLEMWDTVVTLVHRYPSHTRTK